MKEKYNNDEFKLSLVGLFFHSFDKNKIVVWQGVIKKYIGDNYYLIDIFEWITGMDYTTKMIKLSDMENFEFYTSPDDMNNTWEYKLKHRNDKLISKLGENNVEQIAIKILGAVLKTIDITQTELIKKIESLFEHEYGLKKRTLEKYFAIANKIIEDKTQ